MWLTYDSACFITTCKLCRLEVKLGVITNTFSREIGLLLIFIFKMMGHM